MAQLTNPASVKGLLNAVPRHLLPDGTFWRSEGMSMYKGELQFAPGYSVFDSEVLSGVAIMLFDFFVRPDDAERLVCFTTTDAYRWDEAADDWVPITRHVPNPTAAPGATGFASGGSLANGTYNVTYTWYDGVNETMASPATAATVTLGGGNGRIDVTVPTRPPNTTHTRIYARLGGPGGETLIGSTTGTTFTITTIPGSQPTAPASNSLIVQFTGGQDSYWHTDYGPNVASPWIWHIATNGVDPVCIWSTATGGNFPFFRELAGSPSDGGRHYSKAIAIYQQCLFHLNRTEDGRRLPQFVRWSDVNLIETYAGGISSSFTLYQGGFSPGMALETLGPYLAAYRRDYIHLIQLAGEPFFFSQRLVIAGIGLIAPRAVLNLDTKHMFLGNDNVYMFNGVDLQPIADEIRDELFQTMDPGNSDRAMISYDANRHEAALIVPSMQNGGVPDTWWFWNLSTGGWSGPVRNRLCTGVGNYTRQTSLLWSDATWAWDVATGTWSGAGSISGADIVLFGNNDMVAYYINTELVTALGVKVTARYESGAIHPGMQSNPQMQDAIVVEILPLTDATNQDLLEWFVGVADNPTGPFVYQGPFLRGPRGIVKTKPIRGKWFVVAAQCQDSFGLSGFSLVALSGAANP